MSSPRTFFHLKQSWTRMLGLGVFLILIGLSVGLYAGWIDAWKSEREDFLAAMALFSCLGVLAPWIITRCIPTVRARMSVATLGRFEALVALCMVLTWIGALGLYRTDWGYDTMVHAIISGCLAYMFTVALAMALPSIERNPLRLLAIVVCLSITAGVINELFEWGGDQIFGTTMYGQAGEPNDTEFDLMANSIGGIVGMILAYISHVLPQAFATTSGKQDT